MAFGPNSNKRRAIRTGGGSSLGRPDREKSPEGTSKVSLMDFFESVKHGKWIILATFLIVTATVFVITKLTPREYEAASIVYVDTGRQSSPFTQGVGLEDRGLHNELGILQFSYPLAEKVAERIIDMSQQYESLADLPIMEDVFSERPAQTVAWRLMSQTSFALISQNMNMVRIVATSTAPEEAAMIANLYAEEYEKRSREASRASISATRSFLEDQAERRRRDLREIEGEYEAFIQQRGIVMLGADGEYLVQQAASLDARREEAMIELELEQHHLKLVQQELDRLRPGLADQIANNVLNEVSSLQGRIHDLNAQIEEFYARNPNLRGNESQEPALAALIARRQNFESQVSNKAQRLSDEVYRTDGLAGGEGNATLGLVTDLKRQVTERNIAIANLRTLIGELQGRQRTLDSRLGSIPSQQVQLAQLQRERDARTRLHSMLVDRLQETIIAEESELGFVEIIRNAGVPTFPVRPRTTENMTLGMLLGLLFGLGLAFVRRAMSQNIHKPEDVRDAGYNLLGIIPNMNKVVRQMFKGKKVVEFEGKKVNSKLIPLHDPWSNVAESYRYVRTNLQFGRPDKVIQTMLITSANPGEGKTLTAMNLAITIAQGGRRTLYVDADLRQPTGYAQLDLPNKPGLAEIVSGKQELSWGSFATDIDNLYVMPPGDAVDNPAEFIGSKAMREFVLRVREVFDTIIFDVPPVLLVADAVLLSTQVDAAILVVGAGQTDLRALEQATGALDTVGAPTVGVILNRFDGKSTYGYGYGYGRGYGYSYGSDPNRAKRSTSYPSKSGSAKATKS